MDSNSSLDLKNFVCAVREHLVPILYDTLKTCVERHQLGMGKGADMFSFGTDSWSLPARVFRCEAEEESIPFKVKPLRGCVLEYQGQKFRHHRVGFTEKEDIKCSFPKNTSASGKEVTSQLSLFSEPYCPLKEQTIVIAFMANPEDGLCAVYIATVGKVEKDIICEWASTEVVWTRDTIHVDTDVTIDLVPPEDTHMPVVRRRSKRVANDATD